MLITTFDPPLPPGGKNSVVLSDVGSEDLVDPSLNIEDTEKKIERSRRTSKMENEAVTKQKLSLRRMKSQESEQGKSQLADSSLEIVSFRSNQTYFSCD